MAHAAVAAHEWLDGMAEGGREGGVKALRTLRMLYKEMAKRGRREARQMLSEGI